MTKYEQLLTISEFNNVEVVEKEFKSNAKGLIKGNRIGIRKELSQIEKACILAEELGHYYTTSGNILDQSKRENRKQEKIARRWATDELIEIDELIDAVRSGCEYPSDIAEYLGVTEDFLKEALEIFKCRHGVRYHSNGYVLTFNDMGVCVRKEDDDDYY